MADETTTGTPHEGEGGKPPEVPPSPAAAQTGAPTATAGAPPGTPAKAPVKMPTRFFVVELSYLVALIVLFIVYVTSPTVRHGFPVSFGPLPMAIVWFGATGAVVAGMRGIFINNATWDERYNYWYYSRPVYGAVTGSIGALVYWVSIRLGNTKPISVDNATFYVVAFLLGFSGNAFVQLLKSVTDVIIKPGTGQSNAPPQKT